MHCTHSCGSLVKQFPISNEPDLTIYPRKHCRKQDAAAGGLGGCEGSQHSAQDLKYICQIRDNDLIYIIDCLERHKSVALLC